MFKRVPVRDRYETPEDREVFEQQRKQNYHTRKFWGYSDRSREGDDEQRDENVDQQNIFSSASWCSPAPDVDDTQTGNGKQGQKQVTYESFGNDPKDLMYLLSCKTIPKATSSLDVVIMVQASTVSLGDCVLRRGLDMELSGAVCLPATPGWDVVGTIISQGGLVEKKYGFNLKDRVAALVRSGGNARYAVVPASSLVRVPTSVPAAQAACIVSPYMCAYQSMDLVSDSSHRMFGKQVFVIGGTGPIGQALVHFSIKAGASKVFVSAPMKHHKHVKSNLGAIPVPIESEQWLPLMKGKIDVVFDSICEDGSYSSSRAALKSNGRLVCVGVDGLLLQSHSMGLFGAPLSARWAKTKSEYFMGNTQSYEIWESFNRDPEKFKRELEMLFHLAAKREIRPLVAKRIALGHVGNAHKYLEQGKNLGSVVCMPWKRSPFHKTKNAPTEDEEESWFRVT